VTSKTPKVSSDRSVKLWAICYLDSYEITKADSVQGQATVLKHIQRLTNPNK